jgi:hypothetical protein
LVLNTLSLILTLTPSYFKKNNDNYIFSSLIDLIRRFSPFYN